jgi:hypothetical protein
MSHASATFHDVNAIDLDVHEISNRPCVEVTVRDTSGAEFNFTFFCETYLPQVTTKSSDGYSIEDFMISEDDHRKIFEQGYEHGYAMAK